MFAVDILETEKVSILKDLIEDNLESDDEPWMRAWLILEKELPTMIDFVADRTRLSGSDMYIVHRYKPKNVTYLLQSNLSYPYPSREPSFKCHKE